MRSRSIRSLLRTAIAMGVVAAYQSNSFANSWLEFSKPHSKVCFVHDLEWDASLSISSPKSVINDIDLEPHAVELRECINASREFERQKILNSSQSWYVIAKHSIDAISQHCFSRFGTSRNRIVEIGNSGIQHLVQWIQLPESQPIAIFVATSDPHVSDEPWLVNNDWDCIDRDATNASSQQSAHPFGQTGNVFVFSFITTEPEPEFSDDFGSEYFESVSDTNSGESFPPILSGTNSVFQVGVDPVCPDTQMCFDAAPWSSYASEERVCYPIVTEDSDIAECKLAPADAAPTSVSSLLRPPTLESDSCPSDGDGVGHCQLAFVQLEPVNTFNPNPYSEAIASDLENASLDRTSRMFGTDIPLRCFPWMMQRQHWDNFRADGLVAANHVQMFTREDLMHLAEDLTQPSPIFSSPSNNNAAIETSCPLHESWETIRNNVSITAHELWLNAKRTSYQSIIEPWNASRISITDYLVKFIDDSKEWKRVHTSKNVANQIRTVGQFLVDFASLIETEAERVSIAKNKPQSDNSMLK